MQLWGTALDYAPSTKFGRIWSDQDSWTSSRLPTV